MCSFLNARSNEPGQRLPRKLISRDNLLRYCSFFYTAEVTPLAPPHLPSVNLFAFTWKDQLTSRQPKNHGNPYAWCVTTELSVSAAHAPAYLQQAIMVYRFTVSVLTPVQLVYCMES